MSLAVNNQSSALLTLQSLKTGSSDTVRQKSAQNVATSATVQDADTSLSTETAQPSTAQLLTSALAQGASTSDAASAAARSISDLLQQLQQTATAATQSSTGSTISADSTSLDSQFSSLLSQIQGVVKNAGVGGQNLVDGSLSAPVSFATASGGDVSLSPQNLSLGGPIVSVSADASVSTPAGAASVLASVNQSLQNVGSAIQSLDGQADQIGASMSPDAASSSSTGDDDSVRLLALQLQQSLSTQTTSIANQSSQSILSLFRS